MSRSRSILAAVQPVQARHRRQRSGASCSSTSTIGANSAWPAARPPILGGPGGRRADDDRRIEARRGELRSSGSSSPKRCSTTTASGHSISTCFLTSSRYSGAGRDHQQAQAQDRREARRPSRRALQNGTDLSPRFNAIATLLLGFVGSLSLQALQIFGRHIPGDVLPEKHEVSKS
jgi:hypothetical protein